MVLTFPVGVSSSVLSSLQTLSVEAPAGKKKKKILMLLVQKSLRVLLKECLCDFSHQLLDVLDENI